jgi:hypothetical protein
MPWRGKTVKRRPKVTRTKKENRTEDGITFESKANLLRYQELKDQRENGRVRWFIREPRFDLAGVTYKADFLVVWDSGSVSVEEVKSPNYRKRVDWRRTKRNLEQVYHLYGIRVVILERS